jgi:hypothetical protein
MYSRPVAEEPRQPVAIRVSRPYASEDEFLEHELETLTRTSVTLVGSQSRPQGVILRFEVVLSNGTALLRGEGRVVGYKQNAFGDLPGLTLRFTRLDARSKSLVDRAATVREARARAAFNASMTDSVAPPPLPNEAALEIPLAPRIPSIPSAPGAPAAMVDSPLAALFLDAVPLAPATSVDLEPLSLPPLAMETPVSSSSPISLASLEPSSKDVADREPLLEKLRARGRSLSPDSVARILTKRPG